MKKFPNEILIIHNKKPQFINISFTQTFLTRMNLEANNHLIKWDDLKNIGKELKFENSTLTFQDILINPDEYGEISQNQSMIFNLEGNNNEIFTYRTSKISFNNQESLLYIMSNVSCDKKLERANADKIAKQIQVTQITHDMRTPLSSMIQTEEALELTILDPEQEEEVQILKNSTQLLLILVNDCLDLFQNEETKIEPACSLFNIRESLNFCYQLMKFSYRRKGIELIVIMDQNVPKEMYSDENRFKRIIINLLGNALKFTSQGYVKVNVKYFETNNYIVVSVRDTGKGMSKDDLKKLFIRFGKLKDEAGQNLTGMGIGLTVCKDLSNALGGDIDVKSEINIGTKFCFWILKDFNQSFKEEKSPLQIQNISISNFSSEPLNFDINTNQVKRINS